MSSKRNRFEILKRDGFKCQYCGRGAEETRLEVDHIIPKSSGGKDELINLITSCFDCNRGKSDIPIDSLIARPDIAKINEDINNQRKELKLYYSNQKKIRRKKQRTLNLILDIWYSEVSSYISPYKIRSIEMFLDNQYLNPADIVSAIQISSSRVYNRQDRFNYMCGILHNWIRERQK